MKRRRKNVTKDNIHERKTFRARCRNPWKRSCKNIDIAVYIRYRDEQMPICRSCWKEIAKKGHEW